MRRSDHPIDQHSALVRMLANEGSHPKSILQRLHREGCKVTLSSLKKWMIREKLYIEPEEDSTKKDIVLGLPRETTNQHEITVLENQTPARRFDFEREEIELDFYQLATFLQKAHIHLLKRQLEIVANQQADAYRTGDESEYSMNSLRKLQAIANLTYKIAPLDLVAKQQEAVKIVQRMGYELSFNGELLPYSEYPEYPEADQC